MTTTIRPSSPIIASPAIIPPDVLAGLREARADARTRRSSATSIAERVPLFPRRTVLEPMIAELAAALYPRRIGGFDGSEASEDAFVAETLGRAIAALRTEIDRELHYWAQEAGTAFDDDQAATISGLFLQALPEARRLIDSDIDAAFLGDPAARSVDEILVCYPGAIASLHHRIAHQLYGLGAVITARIISELANERTGIDIHPGATIGGSFFIDHGTGVVIGETAIIGERVRLYQHVTLGARSPLGSSRTSVLNRHARHPVVGDDVVIYAGATILGHLRIGNGATIGGNVWLLSDVPAHAVIVQPEARALPNAAALDLRTWLAPADPVFAS